MKIFILLLLLTIAGCMVPTETVVKDCAQDNYICPSGAIVGREPPSCEFSKCPQVESTFCDYGSPKRDYKGQSGEVCMRIKFDCGDQEYFSDECGCGCTVDYTPPNLQNSKVTNN